MQKNSCQSCGMPLNTDADHGTNKDESISIDYCTYCFQDGAFTKDCSMEEMIELCINFIDEFNKNSEKKYTVEEARAGMKEYFPKLKRWAQS